LGTTFGEQDDEVEWEDGDDTDCEVDSNIILPWIIADNFAVSTSELYRSTPKTGKSSVFSKETSDTFMQAQVTASQLTNWAGRAFRGAIEEANGGDAYNNSAGEV
jgi:hypothetical protein